MNIRELIVKLGFKVEGKEALSGVEKALEGIKTRLNALIAIELFKELASLGEEFAKFAQTLQVAANNAGLSVEQLQKLQFAAGQSGISADRMSTALFRLDRIIYEARIGSEQASMVFARMGISREQIDSWQDSNQALMTISQRMTTMTDKSERMAMAIHLMGRGSKEMVDFLSKGPATIQAVGDQFDKLGAIIRGPEITALVNLERAFQRLEGVVKALWAALASKIAPILESMIDSWLEFSKGFHDFISNNNEQFWLDLAFALGFVEGLVIGLIMDFQNLFKTFHLGSDEVWTFMKFVLGVVAAFGLLTAAIAVYNTLGAIAAVITAALTAPIWLVIAAVIALVYVLHELFELFTGHATDTYTYRIYKWIDSFQALHNIIESVKDAYREWISLAEKGIGYADHLLSFAGLGTQAADASAGAITNNIGGGPMVYAPTNHVEVNASSGASAKDIADLVGDKLQEHHDRNMRELQRGTVNAQPKGY